MMEVGMNHNIQEQGSSHYGSVALKIESVSVRFGGLQALSDVTFDVPTGSIFGVLGPNGAGKTTLLNIITGFQQGDSGRVLAHGNDISGLPSFKVTKTGLARTFQNVRLFRGLTVLEQVIAGAWAGMRQSTMSGILGTPGARHEREAVREKAMNLLQRVGIQEHSHRLAESLPYGERRRVEIARALATEPTVLLLDEPSAGMSLGEWEQLGVLFENLRGEGLTLVVVEHNMRLVRRHCDAAAILNQGTLLAYGSPEECLSDPRVHKAYLGV